MGWALPANSWRAHTWVRPYKTVHTPPHAIRVHGVIKIPLLFFIPGFFHNIDSNYYRDLLVNISIVIYLIYYISA